MLELNPASTIFLVDIEPLECPNHAELGLMAFSANFGFRAPAIMTSPRLEPPIASQGGQRLSLFLGVFPGAGFQHQAGGLLPTLLALCTSY